MSKIGANSPGKTPTYIPTLLKCLYAFRECFRPSRTCFRCQFRNGAKIQVKKLNFFIFSTKNAIFIEYVKCLKLAPIRQGDLWHIKQHYRNVYMHSENDVDPWGHVSGVNCIMAPKYKQKTSNIFFILVKKRYFYKKLAPFPSNRFIWFLNY